MKKWMAAFAIVSVLCVATPLAAQQPQAAPIAEEQIALARQYASIGGAEASFLAGTAYGFRQAALASGVEFTDSQWAHVRAALDEACRPAAELFVRELANFYAEHATREDMRAAIEFYATPAGVRYVHATQAYTLPLSVHLASNGRVPLQAAPSLAGVDAARIELGRQIAADLLSKFHSTERTALALTTLGVSGYETYVAQSLAASLSAEELSAALAWAQSEASMRLEGPSAERSLRMQNAMLLATRLIDVPTVVRAIETARSELPA